MFSAFQSNAFQSNAFQIITKIVGGLGKAASRKRHKRFYVEYKNEILVFENADQAHAWTEYQSQLQSLAKNKRKKVIRNLKVEAPLEKIDLTSVKDIAEQYGKASTVNDLLNTNQLAEVVTSYKDLLKLQLKAIVKRVQDDEDEIEMLLLSI